MLLNDGAKRNRLLYLKIMYTKEKNLMFAKYFVTFCSIFGRVFSYATQVKVCKKFGEFCSIFGMFFSYATQVKVCKTIGDFLLHFRESFTIFENHVYRSKNNLMFAQKLEATPFFVESYFFKLHK
jgi:hypothetical protein